MTTVKPEENQTASLPTGVLSRHASKGVAVLSRFTIANEMRDQVMAAFIDRPHWVEDAPGFLSMEVMSPLDNPNEVWLLTFWTDDDCYETWHKSHHYHQSHQGIPKGLKLVPRSAEIRKFEYICS